MANDLYRMNVQTVKTVLQNNEPIALLMREVGEIYGLPSEHVLLLSGALQSRLPKGAAASRKKLEKLCDMVVKGRIEVVETNKELILSRLFYNGKERQPSEFPSAGKHFGWKRRLDPFGMVAFAILCVGLLLAAGAIGFVVWRFLKEIVL